MGWLEERDRSTAGAAAPAVCPSCRSSVEGSHQFCGSCGHDLSGATAPPRSDVIVVPGSAPVADQPISQQDELLVIDAAGSTRFEASPRLVVDLTEPEPPTVTLPPGPTAPPAAPGVAQPAAVREKRALHVSRTTALVGGGILLVVALVVAAILLWPEDTVEIDTDAELASGSEQLSESVRAFSDADQFEDLRAAATAATDGAGTYQDRIDALADLGDEELLAAAVGVLGAERTLLQSLGRTFEDYATRDFRVWPQRSETLERRVNQLEARQDALAALENEDITAVADVDAAHEMITDLNRLVDAKIEEYQAWVEERDRAAGSKAAALFGLNAYARPMQDLISQYSGLRAELDRWTDRLDTEIVYASEAYDVLGDAVDARVSVGNQMRALQPPPALANVHASLVALIDEASSAVESAYASVTEYLYDSYYGYWDVRNTPEWGAFEDASSRISANLDASISSWNAARDAEEQRIQAQPVPERPEL